MVVIRESRLNINVDELNKAIYLLKNSGLAAQIKKSDYDKKTTLGCHNINPPQAAGYLAHACEVVASYVGLSPKEQVRYEPRKKMTIYPALKKAIADIIKN